MKKSRDCCYVLLGAFLFGIMPVIIKNSYSYGANGFNITFYMALLSIPVYGLIVKLLNVSVRLPKKKIIQCVVVGLADAGTFLLLYLSYAYIPVGVSSMLNFIYPVTIALAMYLLYGEKFGFAKIIALFIYLIGLGFLYGGNFSGRPIGFVLALLSGISYTVHAIFLDKSGLANENIYVVGLYKAIVVAVVTGVIGGILRVPMNISGWQAWSSIFIVMLLCRIGSTALIMLGIRGLGAFLPSVLSTIEPVVVLLTGWLILHEKISWIQLVGVVLILTAVLLIVLSDQSDKE